MKVTLEFTVEEINHVLAALGNRPFVEVANLIEKIRKEAEAQIANQAPAAEVLESE
jgi:hypothetical protein